MQGLNQRSFWEAGSFWRMGRRPDCSQNNALAQLLSWFTLMYLFKIILYWRTANGQCCDTAKGPRHACTCTHSSPNSPPIQAAAWCWSGSPVLYSRTLLVIHFKYSSVYISISNSLTIPFPLVTISLSYGTSFSFKSGCYLVDTAREGEGGTKRESSMETYTLLLLLLSRFSLVWLCATP